ncbi:MAG TPA: hypothetical protein VFI31_25750 [Pirellulales bacterium]|nr:hypothetical protein [Pirellulales bacterium]
MRKLSYNFDQSKGLSYLESLTLRLAQGVAEELPSLGVTMIAV